MCFKGIEVRCLSASWIAPQRIWLFCMLSQRTYCRPSSPDLTGTEVILAGESAWLHCTKGTCHQRHAKDSKNCLIIPPRVEDKGRSRAAMGDDQTVWDSAVLGNACSEAAVLLGRTTSSVPSQPEWSFAFSSLCLILTTAEKNYQLPLSRLVYSPFPQPMRLHRIIFWLKATSTVLHLLILSRAGELKENGTPASLRCEGVGSMVLVCAVASAHLLPDSVVKSTVVPGNTFILSFFVLLPLSVRNQRIKLF